MIHGRLKKTLNDGWFSPLERIFHDAKIFYHKTAPLSMVFQLKPKSVGTIQLSLNGTARAGISSPPRIRSLNLRKSASCGHCSFRLISPRAKLPPQAVARGSSPHGFSSRFAPGRKNRKEGKFLPVIFVPSRNFPSSRRTRRRCGLQSRGKRPLDNPPDYPQLRLLLLGKW